MDSDSSMSFARFVGLVLEAIRAANVTYLDSQYIDLWAERLGVTAIWQDLLRHADTPRF